ncbi:hypothetical protein K438DRAFT_156636 [Mycena galopus ATCC 62051]|nr:hypothetical protein K438DRAFT_156636 [Mycena galopus ATCC 62051]
MTRVRTEFAPAVSNYLQQEPDDTQRKSLIQSLVQSLVRLDKTAMQPDWAGRIERRRAVEEVLRLLNTLEWLPASDSSAGPADNISKAEQDMLTVIASEMSNVQTVLAPAVATFPRSNPQQSDERELRDLSRSLFEAVQRLDSTRINQTGSTHERKEEVSYVQSRTCRPSSTLCPAALKNKMLSIKLRLSDPKSNSSSSLLSPAILEAQLRRSACAFPSCCSRPWND